MEKHIWKEIPVTDDLICFYICQCIKCDMYRIIFKTKIDYATFYSYDLPQLKENTNEHIIWDLDNNSIKSAPNCISKEIIDELLKK
jgi:hypothetical protein